jgi:hypothetical protein
MDANSEIRKGIAIYLLFASFGDSRPPRARLALPRAAVARRKRRLGMLFEYLCPDAIVSEPKCITLSNANNV